MSKGMINAKPNGAKILAMTANDDFTTTKQIVELLQQFKPEDQQRLLRWAGEKLGLAPQAATAPAPKYHRLLAVHKNSSDRLFAAAVAYAQKFHAPSGFTKEFVTAADLVAAARQIDRSGPKHASQTLINAAQSGLLKKATHGKYALTALGRTAVEAAITQRG